MGKIVLYIIFMVLLYFGGKVLVSYDRYALSVIYFLIWMGLLLFAYSKIYVRLYGESLWSRKTKHQNSDSGQPKEKTPSPQLQQQKSTPRPAGKSGSGVIFISYRRSDSAHVTGRIYDRLVGSFGKDSVFKDVDSIPFGVDFKEYLDKKVGECTVLLAIIGDKWLEARDATGSNRLESPTDFVRIEIESAIARGIPLIPLLVGGAPMPSEEKLPASLRKLAYRNGIPIRPDPDFHRDMDRLISALEKYAGQK